MNMNSDGKRDYRFIDPDKIDTSNVEPVPGTNGQCLADALLDVIMVGQDSGMTDADVDEALRIVNDYLAGQERRKFRLHVIPGGEDEGDAKA
jgi:hypothetical protein